MAFDRARTYSEASKKDCMRRLTKSFFDGNARTLLFIAQITEELRAYCVKCGLFPYNQS